MVKIDVSIGELVDKVSILAIKLRKIDDEGKLQNIRREFDLLSRTMEAEGITTASPEYRRLEEINLKLWDIEDLIRIKESEKNFDDEFISLARSVYFRNDERAAVKREINMKFGSALVEEKSYAPYA